MPGTRRSPRGQPEFRPEFFTDRDVGRVRVPGAIRDMGYEVHTLYDVYGAEAEQGTKDPEWIRDCGKNGRVVVCRDKLRHDNEKELVKEHGTKVFRIARSAKNADQMIAYLQTNKHRIVQASRKRGPFIYRVEANSIVPIMAPTKYS